MKKKFVGTWLEKILHGYNLKRYTNPVHLPTYYFSWVTWHTQTQTECINTVNITGAVLTFALTLQIRLVLEKVYPAQVYYYTVPFLSNPTWCNVIPTIQTRRSKNYFPDNLHGIIIIGSYCVTSLCMTFTCMYTCICEVVPFLERCYTPVLHKTKIKISHRYVLALYYYRLYLYVSFLLRGFSMPLKVPFLWVTCCASYTTYKNIKRPPPFFLDMSYPWAVIHACGDIQIS